MKNSRHICVLVGAGMSTGAGIPTFRGEGGVWSTEAAVRQAFEIDRFVSNKKSRQTLWRWLADSPAWAARPTQAHWALKQLDEAGGLISVMTQNFDMLEKKAGIRQGRIRQLHGRIDKSICLGCGRFFDTKKVCNDLVTSPDPKCPDCGGILKPDIVFFGEGLSEPMLNKIYHDDIPGCDELWCVGSSLAVYPAAGLPMLAKQSGKKVIIINKDPTPLDPIADQVIRGDANRVVADLVRRNI